MERNIIIAGFGGQGVLLTGTILANAFMLADKNVICCPCYGAEMRGGEVNCEVAFADEGEVCANNPEVDTVIALNQLSFDKFIKRLKKGGTIIANSSLVKKCKPRNDVNYVFAMISDMAKDLGDIRTANMISLGMLAQVENLSLEMLQNAVRKVFSSKSESILELNFQALKKGLTSEYQN